jgi:hypothetical protein
MVTLLVMLSIQIAPSASSAAMEAHECVHLDGCGCFLVIEHGSCPSGLSHFAHELLDGAPLHFRISGVDFVAQPQSQAPSLISFTRDAADPWSELYSSEFGSVDVAFSPAPSTCMKADEACEYFDVSAELIVHPVARAAYSVRARGVCGC